jgi:ribosomal protein S18 acetylase RimI-like enzyme
MIDAELVKDLVIREINSDDAIPYGLLLDADPSRNAISKYLKSSEIHIALLKGKIIATLVLYPLDATTVEIKNIAVDSKLQGKGIGQLLLENARRIAVTKNARTIVIGTSNSSVGQLYLYQKAGFEITDIKRNFFLDNYSKAIFENGIQCKHMIVLTKCL